jgi:hypothetical protein
MKDSPSPSYIDQAIMGLAVIMIAGTLILPFAHGAIVGADQPNAAGTHVPSNLLPVLGNTNLPLPAGWLVPGPAMYALPGMGSYPFIDPGAGTNQPQQFYGAHWP